MTESNIEEYRKKLKSYRKSAGRVKLRRRLRNPFKLVPWSSVLLIAALAISMKSFVILRIGEAQVERRLARVDQSVIPNQIGVFVMTPGPVSRQLGDWARPIVGGRSR